MSNATNHGASVIRAQAAIKPRKLADVPFVELYGQRLQGVVSSGSDVNRVYVSFFEVGTTNYSCSTNNNRPCGGGGLCKHLRKLLEEAAVQYGVDRVARFLQLPADVPPSTAPKDLVRYIKGSPIRAEAGMGFSRFLNYLRFVELPASCEPIPEMSWFT
jgi:hypothetical protein